MSLPQKNIALVLKFTKFVTNQFFWNRLTCYFLFLRASNGCKPCNKSALIGDFRSRHHITYNTSIPAGTNSHSIAQVCTCLVSTRYEWKEPSSCIKIKSSLPFVKVNTFFCLVFKSFPPGHHHGVLFVFFCWSVLPLQINSLNDYFHSHYLIFWPLNFLLRIRTLHTTILSPCYTKILLVFKFYCDIQGSHLIGSLWVSLIIDQSKCLVCYFLCTELTLFCTELTLFCTELTLFCTELPENCIHLNQSELSNFFMCIIKKKIIRKLNSELTISIVS